MSQKWYLAIIKGLSLILSLCVYSFRLTNLLKSTNFYNLKEEIHST